MITHQELTAPHVVFGAHLGTVAFIGTMLYSLELKLNDITLNLPIMYDFKILRKIKNHIQVVMNEN